MPEEPATERELIDLGNLKGAFADAEAARLPALRDAVKRKPMRRELLLTEMDKVVP